jgi:hypothetical protein
MENYVNANINLDGFQPKEGDSEKVILAKAKALKSLTQDPEDMNLLDQILDYGPLGLGGIILASGISLAAVIMACSATTIARYIGC